nr:hypothetical protein [Tanacetum cinerariifolium]
MIAFLTKSDTSEGFDQIVNFLNAPMIRYAFMVNPTIYVSCIKKFWTSVSIKKSNDVMRLQALIDRKKVIITEDTVRQALRLDDVAGIDCLPNEEIFAELARMGYENLSSMASAVICLAIVGDLFSHNTKYTSPAFPQKAVEDATEDEDDDHEVSTKLTLPSPTPVTTPPPQQELIPSPPQAKYTPLPLPTQEHIPLPHQAQPAQPSSPPPQQPL